MDKKNIAIWTAFIFVSSAIAGGVVFWAGKVEKETDATSKAITDINTTIPSNKRIFTKEQESNKITPPNVEDWKAAKWMIYRDEINGFEFQYPDSSYIDNAFSRNYADYQEGDITIRHKDTVRYLRELNYPPAEETSLVRVIVRKNPERASLISWFEKYDSGCINSEKPNCESSYYSVKSRTISGNSALVVGEYAMMTSEKVFVYLGERIIEFRLAGSSVDANGGDNFFARMIESFKVIK